MTSIELLQYFHILQDLWIGISKAVDTELNLFLNSGSDDLDDRIKYSTFFFFICYIKCVIMRIKWSAHFGLTSFHHMLPNAVMSVRNERCLSIPLSIFSLCPNQKHTYKHSFALPSVYVNPIHFGQSICSVYTHGLQWGTKGPL